MVTFIVAFSFFLFRKVHVFYVFECFACMNIYAPNLWLAGALGVKRAADPLQLELQPAMSPSCECWKMNPGPL